MYFVLSIVIILYAALHIFFRKNDTFLKLRRWVDITAGILALIIVATAVGVFHYSYLFAVYFIISAGIIAGLTVRIRKEEEKRRKAEEAIKVLKDETQVLQGEIDENKKPDSPTQ